ncbi:MAG: N-acetylmuramoyl-L-alanine amidase [Mogibacterium sp.]|nr:N-acetylmuramoyl-L-alanine amidase [Mogibacterium sp.]
MSDKTIETAIQLVADICKRNGIKKLNYTGDLSGNLCMHCWVCSTACPGTYLKSKFRYIASEVNKLLGAGGPFLVKVSCSDLYIRKGPVQATRRKAS